MNARPRIYAVIRLSRPHVACPTVFYITKELNNCHEMSKIELIFKEILGRIPAKRGLEAQFGTWGSPEDAVSTGNIERIVEQWLLSQEIVPKGGACMASSRSAVLLLLLSCPAVAYLAASLEDVSASSQCLSSAEAVRQEYPGSWPSWTTHAANHKGTKCWFPAMRENHSRHMETLLRKSAEAQANESQTHKTPAEQRRPNEPAVNNKSPENAPLASASEMNELGWSFRSRTTKVGPVSIFDEFTAVESSFDDRFAAAREVSSVSQPSVIQRMMDPVGAIP